MRAEEALGLLTGVGFIALLQFAEIGKARPHIIGQLALWMGSGRSRELVEPRPWRETAAGQSRVCKAEQIGGTARCRIYTDCLGASIDASVVETCNQYRSCQSHSQDWIFPHKLSPPICRFGATTLTFGQSFLHGVT